MDYLALYSRSCKTCKSLDPDEEVLYPKCHFEQGNVDCPAKEIQLAVVGLAQRCARLIVKARSEGDLVKEIKILRYVAKKSPAFQQKFKDWSSK